MANEIAGVEPAAIAALVTADSVAMCLAWMAADTVRGQAWSVSPTPASQCASLHVAIPSGVREGFSLGRSAFAARPTGGTGRGRAAVAVRSPNSPGRRSLVGRPRRRWSSSATPIRSPAEAAAHPLTTCPTEILPSQREQARGDQWRWSEAHGPVCPTRALYIRLVHAAFDAYGHEPGGE